MWRSRFLSITSAALAAIAASGAGGCSGPDCGPGKAAADGLVASGSGVTLTYGGLMGSPNNDCPDPAAPKGVISLTITGMQTDGTGLVTICVPRPDRLGGAQALGIGGSAVQLVDLNGSSAGCTFALGAGTMSGTISGRGVCDDGASKDGWAMTANATLPVMRTCGTNVDTISLTLAGTVAVAGP